MNSARRALALGLCTLSMLTGCGGGGGGSSTSTPPPQSLTIITDTSVRCVESTPFSLTLQDAAASGAVTWSVISGQLPSGLSLNAMSGVISGTPTASTISNATIQAADAKTSTSKSFVFLVWQKLAVNPVSVPAAHLNAPYSLQMTATASGAIASWTVTGGELPPGLTLNNSGAIAGTPSQAGTFPFTVQAQDYTIPQTATANFSIVVDTHLTITKASLKKGEQNQAYSDFFVAVNGTPPYTWTLSGNLASGLSFNSASGQISGTPTGSGSFPYSISVADSSSSSQTDSGQGALSIATPLQVIGTLAPAYIGKQYSGQIIVIGGYYPYTYSIASGGLPPGLSLTIGGGIVGTPTQLGSSTFTLEVSDSGTPPFSITPSITLAVTPVPLSILGNPLSPAPVTVLYHSQIPVSGGTPPYSWSITSGQLPLGLSLDPATGYIDGTPTQVGTFNFVAKGTDSGVPPQTAGANDFIQIRTPLGRNDSIATATPLGNSANQQQPIPLSISPYVDPIDSPTANPDTDFYRLVANAGGLVHIETYAQRTWLTNPLDSVIEILDGSGNRLQSCTSPNYVADCLNNNKDSTTRDSALDLKVPGSAGQTTFYLHVFDWRGDARPDMHYYLNISGLVEPLKISVSTLGAGATRGVSYQRQLASSGGTGAVTWSVDGGSLPTGWSLSSGGLLSGTAAADGFYTFTVLATDSGSPAQTARAEYTVQIAEALVITSPATWPNACVNQPYSFTIQTSGGIAPLHYGFFSSAWVPINLDQSSGTFSGVAGGTGTFTGTLGVGDSAEPSSGQTQVVSLTVINCP